MYKNNLQSSPTCKDATGLSPAPRARGTRQTKQRGHGPGGVGAPVRRGYEEALWRLVTERELSSLSTMVRA